MRTEEFISLGLLQLEGAGSGMSCQKQGKFTEVKIMMGKQEESQSGQLEQEMGSGFR